MSNLPTEITALAVLAAVLFLIVKDYIFSRKWKVQEIMDQDKMIEKKDEQIMALVDKFNTTTLEFTVVIANHLKHQEDCMREIHKSQKDMAEAINRLCELWENGK